MSVEMRRLRRLRMMAWPASLMPRRVAHRCCRFPNRQYASMHGSRLTTMTVLVRRPLDYARAHASFVDESKTHVALAVGKLST
jgi:hypothetical protein